VRAHQFRCSGNVVFKQEKGLFKHSYQCDEVVAFYGVKPPCFRPTRQRCGRHTNSLEDIRSLHLENARYPPEEFER
jgi:hypothetical protein